MATDFRRLIQAFYEFRQAFNLTDLCSSSGERGVDGDKFFKVYSRKENKVLEIFLKNILYFLKISLFILKFLFFYKNKF